MLKSRILFLLVLTICGTIKAQDYQHFYLQINSANTLAQKGQIDSAITIYENAFKKVDYVHTRILTKVLKLAKLNKDQVRIDKYNNQIETQLKGKNPKLIAVIDSLVDEDQRIRDNKHSRAANYWFKCLHNEQCNTESKKFLKAEKLRNDFQSTDSLNIDYLLRLFERYGFIGEELVGDRYFGVIVLLTHFDADNENKVLKPIFIKARKEGKILPLNSAQIMDRHSYNYDHTQTYWTWAWSSREKFGFSDSDIDRIKELREGIWIYGSELSQETKRGFWVVRNKYAY